MYTIAKEANGKQGGKTMDTMDQAEWFRIQNRCDQFIFSLDAAYDDAYDENDAFCNFLNLLGFVAEIVGLAIEFDHKIKHLACEARHAVKSFNL
jgi:hypothetical protein